MAFRKAKDDENAKIYALKETERKIIMYEKERYRKILRRSGKR